MLSNIIKQFKENIDGLKDFVELVEPFLNEKENEMMSLESENLLPLLIAISELDNEIILTPKQRAKIESIHGKIITKVEENENHKSINFSFEKNNLEFNKALKKINKTKFQKELLYKSSLMSLTCTAEWFIYQLFHKFYNLYPFPLEHKEKFFSLDELKSFSSIDDAKNFLISTKIDKIMRQGFEEWFSSLKKTDILGLKLIQVDKFKLDITEIFQRRHLLVHNGGIVNEFYLQKVDTTKSKGIQKGEKLTLSNDYINNAIENIELCFLLIAFELWQKIDPDGIQRRSTLINNYIFEYIKNEKYIIAENLAHFYCSQKNLNEQNMLMGKLNYWQCIKWQGRYNEIIKDVNQADFTAKDELFKVGYYAICDNKELFFANFEDVIKNNKITIDDAMSWPIFKEMRKENQFTTIISKYE